jgi:hypothetical protein
MSLRRILLPLGVAAVAVCGLAQPAFAGMLRCAEQTLTPKDRGQLATAIKSALPASVPIDASPGICRNPGSARAWLETKHHTNAEGAQEWWVVNCTRETRDWNCESPERKREISLSAPLSGAVRHLSIEFDDKTTMEQARELSIRSFQILEATADPPSECIEAGQDTVDADGWSKMQNLYRLKPSDVNLTATVSMDGDSFSVWISQDGGLALTFLRPSRAADAPTLKCWSEWVVVT